MDEIGGYRSKGGTFAADSTSDIRKILYLRDYHYAMWACLVTLISHCRRVSNCCTELMPM